MGQRGDPRARVPDGERRRPPRGGMDPDPARGAPMRRGGECPCGGILIFMVAHIGGRHVAARRPPAVHRDFWRGVEFSGPPAIAPSRPRSRREIVIAASSRIYTWYYRKGTPKSSWSASRLPPSRSGVRGARFPQYRADRAIIGAVLGSASGARRHLRCLSARSSRWKICGPRRCAPCSSRWPFRPADPRRSTDDAHGFSWEPIPTR